MAEFSQFIYEKSWVNGTWQTASSGRIFDIFNPADGKKIASVPDMDAADTEKAIAAAKAAFKGWSGKTAKEREPILKAWHRLIVENQESLAWLLSTEQGKPLAEARAEIGAGASSIEWFANEGRRVYGETVPTHKSDVRTMVIKQPVGVVGAITPWNFPHSMITRKVGPALAAGCTVVLKPAEDAPLSALALAALSEKAGIPPGVFNVITSSRANAAAVGRVLSTHPDVSKISFTGSTEVGKILMKQAADTVKRVSMELGGNAPFIVFESADLDKAADGAIICKFRNAGQTCICANRIYVQESVHDKFVEKLAERVRKMKIGHGTADGTVIGPLINERAVAKVQSHLDDAVKKGGKVVTGGKVSSVGPLFFEPTLIDGMTPEMVVRTDETFGPIAGVFTFKDEADIIRQANDTIYGLASYFYSKDLGQVFRVSEALEYGMVGVNEPLIVNEAYPFGGVKQSGVGRENSHYGIDEYIDVKLVVVGGL